MSKRIDDERREDALHAQVERAKEKLRHGHELVRLHIEGVPAAEAARRMGLSRSTVMRLRVWLELESGRAWRAGAKCAGRLDSRRDIEEAW